MKQLNLQGPIFLVRHAAYANGPNPGLSECGKEQSLRLAKKIKRSINEAGCEITIWSSSANRAVETAQIIRQEMQLAEMIVEEKLWSDNSHREDFEWLKQKLEGHKGGVLIIVSHFEYVRLFPAEIGFKCNSAGYAEGVKIENGNCVDF
ncbi:histidine phosphatase family protein [bacterium]|nr:MAG: histidine phosphatase family protein [bacterium]